MLKNELTIVLKPTLDSNNVKTVRANVTSNGKPVALPSTAIKKGIYY